MVSRDKFKSSPPVDRATDSEWIRIVLPELARWRCRDTFKVVSRMCFLLPRSPSPSPRQVIFRKTERNGQPVNNRRTRLYHRHREIDTERECVDGRRIDRECASIKKAKLSLLSAGVTMMRLPPRVTGSRNWILGALSRSNAVTKSPATWPSSNLDRGSFSLSLSLTG